MVGALPPAARKSFKRFGVYWKFGLSAALVYFYFARERKLQIKHDAALAREFCPEFVKGFMKCEVKNAHGCRKEMLFLHDCVHRFKTDNQMDIDRLL